MGKAADRLGLPAFLVGGAVRDILRGRKNLDWDIVTEGNPEPLVKRLSELWKGKIIHYPQFGTYILAFNRKRHVDFATARKETYPRPGSLPVVKPSNLKHDLFRRDFTINALAVRLNTKGHGSVIDYYGGEEDLRTGTLRILHARSFRDDPTRILRLARFAARGFAIDTATLRLVARDKKYMPCVTSERLREEIMAILKEQYPSRALNMLKKWGVLTMILPGMRLEKIEKKIDSARSLPARFAALFFGLSDARAAATMEKLQISRKIKREVETLRHPRIRPVLSGDDLIGLGYKPGPLFREILNSIARHHITSRREAIRHVFDNFPQKI